MDSSSTARQVPSTLAEWAKWIPAPGLMQAIGGCELQEADSERGLVRARFTCRPEFCHTGGTVAQGGFISAWMDFAMAFATVVRSGMASNVASLDLHVSFLERGGPGQVVAEGRVLRMGRKVAFLEASLFNAQGRLAATASSSALLVPYAAPDAGRTA